MVGVGFPLGCYCALCGEGWKKGEAEHVHAAGPRMWKLGCWMGPCGCHCQAGAGWNGWMQGLPGIQQKLQGTAVAYHTLAHRALLCACAAAAVSKLCEEFAEFDSGLVEALLEQEDDDIREFRFWELLRV